ncbi:MULTISPECIES: hypothetical protein [Paenibacillus]|uniref:hypothetical protein n=1 Tax=Paenibacillus TaxID=44249 RepID=UPI0004B492DA|nr:MULTISPECIES: hypothetical protein [Paenibacillus]GIO90884.1 hypothetical protein J31TS3_21110 [Paenibacillus lactis]
MMTPDWADLWFLNKMDGFLHNALSVRLSIMELSASEFARRTGAVKFERRGVENDE